MLDSPCVALNKIRNTKDAVSPGSKQYFLLHVTCHIAAIEALQTTKITKLSFLSLPPMQWFKIKL